MALILDTSALLAALDTADPDHERCAKLIADSHEELVVPVLVLGELDYWCHERLTADVWLNFLLNEPKLATLDHRHFGTMRPRHIEALELLPAAS